MSSSSSFSYSDFSSASRKKRKNRKAPQTSSALRLSSLLPPLREQLGQGEWFAQCSQILKGAWGAFSAKAANTTAAVSSDAGTAAMATVQVLCLGLGSPTSSQNARVQLAFLAEACTSLNVAHDRILLHDPVFTDEDLSLFKELEMKVLEPEKGTDYTLRGPTICFMPHCDLGLYESVLRANWSKEGLPNIFLLGNNLQAYLDNKPTSELKSTAPCVLRLAPLLRNHALPPSPTWPTAFNNTSVQFLDLKARDDNLRDSGVGGGQGADGLNGGGGEDLEAEGGRERHSSSKEPDGPVAVDDVEEWLASVEAIPVPVLQKEL